MDDFKIIVKPWMTNYDKFMDKDSFLMKQNISPMPLCVMYGKVLKQSEKMIYMELHGDIVDAVNFTCAKCGKELKHPVSQCLGIGPECGEHAYINPFNTLEELEAAVAEMRTKLQNIKWTGWIPKSGIVDLISLGDKILEDYEEEECIINIKVDKSQRCNGEYSLFLTFPYNKEAVDIVRSQIIRYWLPDTKEWELPIKCYEQLTEYLKNFKINVDDVNEILFSQILNTDMISHIPENYEFKVNPFKHQVEGIEYGLKYDRFLLGDEQGLGKTMQVINIACIKKETRNYKHCLIICGVNGLKWNWKAEVEKHSNETGYILGTRYDKKGKSKIGSLADRLEDLEQMENFYLDDNISESLVDFNKFSSYFIITNIETLRNEKIIEKLKRLCENNIINMIALDEGHKCKDVSSIQGKALLKLQAETLISMTGTPLMNNPLDLYIHLRWLGYEKHNYYSFKQHYCVFGGFGGYQIVGYKNLDQLKSQFDDIMLRRLKKEVLDLPEKIHTTEYVEMTPKQAKIYKEATLEVQNNIDKVTSAVNPLAEMIRMRQATGYTGILSSTIQESAKLDRLEEIIEELVANNSKAIIFSNWTAMTNPTYERLIRFNPAIITGETKDRVAEQDKFMNDDSCKIIIGTTGAMGTGLTLTAANTVIFLDEPWNKALKDQAEDRAHRIGTKENVNIITLICKNTIDERVHDLVEKKGQMSDLLVDGKLTAQNRENLVNFLLS